MSALVDSLAADRATRAEERRDRCHRVGLGQAWDDAVRGHTPGHVQDLLDAFASWLEETDQVVAPRTS